LIIKYKALAKRIESSNDLLSMVSPIKAQTPGVESIKKFNNERRRFSNPNTKGASNIILPVSVLSEHRPTSPNNENYSYAQLPTNLSAELFNQ